MCGVAFHKVAAIVKSRGHDDFASLAFFAVKSPGHDPAAIEEWADEEFMQVIILTKKT
jgi:hypothetical protein